MDNRSLFEAPAERPSIERLLYEPNIAINGPIDDSTVHFFLDCLQKVRTDGEDLVMELVTNGGDAALPVVLPQSFGSSNAIPATRPIALARASCMAPA
jgi:hypothetical protein